MKTTLKNPKSTEAPWYCLLPPRTIQKRTALQDPQRIKVNTNSRGPRGETDPRINKLSKLMFIPPLLPGTANNKKGFTDQNQYLR